MAKNKKNRQKKIGPSASWAKSIAQNESAEQPSKFIQMNHDESIKPRFKVASISVGEIEQKPHFNVQPTLSIPNLRNPQNFFLFTLLATAGYLTKTANASSEHDIFNSSTTGSELNNPSLKFANTFSDVTLEQQCNASHIKTFSMNEEMTCNQTKTDLSFYNLDNPSLNIQMQTPSHSSNIQIEAGSLIGMMTTTRNRTNSAPNFENNLQHARDVTLKVENKDSSSKILSRLTIKADKIDTISISSHFQTPQDNIELSDEVTDSTIHLNAKPISKQSDSISVIPQLPDNADKSQFRSVTQLIKEQRIKCYKEQPYNVICDGNAERLLNIDENNKGEPGPVIEEHSCGYKEDNTHSLNFSHNTLGAMRFEQASNQHKAVLKQIEEDKGMAKMFVTSILHGGKEKMLDNFGIYDGQLVTTLKPPIFPTDVKLNHKVTKDGIHIADCDESLMMSLSENTLIEMKKVVKEIENKALNSRHYKYDSYTKWPEHWFKRRLDSLDKHIDETLERARKRPTDLSPADKASEPDTRINDDLSWEIRYH